MAKHPVTASDPNVESGATVGMFVENEYLLRLNIYNSPPTKLNLAACTSFKLGIGNLNSTSVLLESPNSEFQAGDWASWDLATGKICCRISTNNATLEAWLGSAVWKTAYLEVKATDPVGESTVAMFPVRILGTVFAD